MVVGFFNCSFAAPTFPAGGAPVDVAVLDVADVLLVGALIILSLEIFAGGGRSENCLLPFSSTQTYCAWQADAIKNADIARLVAVTVCFDQNLNMKYFQKMCLMRSVFAEFYTDEDVSASFLYNLLLRL